MIRKQIYKTSRTTLLYKRGDENRDGAAWGHVGQSSRLSDPWNQEWIYAAIFIATTGFSKKVLCARLHDKPLDRTITPWGKVCFVSATGWYRVACKARLIPIRQIRQQRFLMTKWLFQEGLLWITAVSAVYYGEVWSNLTPCLSASLDTSAHTLFFHPGPIISLVDPDGHDATHLTNEMYVGIPLAKLSIPQARYHVFYESF